MKFERNSLVILQRGGYLQNIPALKRLQFLNSALQANEQKIGKPFKNSQGGLNSTRIGTRGSNIHYGITLLNGDSFFLFKNKKMGLNASLRSKPRFNIFSIFGKDEPPANQGLWVDIFETKNKRNPVNKLLKKLEEKFLGKK